MITFHDKTFYSMLNLHSYRNRQFCLCSGRHAALLQFHKPNKLIKWWMTPISIIFSSLSSFTFASPCSSKRFLDPIKTFPQWLPLLHHPYSFLQSAPRLSPKPSSSFKQIYQVAICCSLLSIRKKLSSFLYVIKNFCSFCAATGEPEEAPLKLNENGDAKKKNRYSFQ